MPDLITVGSLAHTAIRITDPGHDLTTGEPMTAVINGVNHSEAAGGIGITDGVDAGLFHRWLDHAKRTGMDLAGLVFEVKADQPEKDSPVAVKQAVVDQPEPAQEAPVEVAE